jgi:hypothetical protein
MSEHPQACSLRARPKRASRNFEEVEARASTSTPLPHKRNPVPEEVSVSQRRNTVPEQLDMSEIVGQPLHAHEDSVSLSGPGVEDSVDENPQAEAPAQPGNSVPSTPPVNWPGPVDKPTNTDRPAKVDSGWCHGHSQAAKAGGKARRCSQSSQKPPSAQTSDESLLKGDLHDHCDDTPGSVSRKSEHERAPGAPVVSRLTRSSVGSVSKRSEHKRAPGAPVVSRLSGSFVCQDKKGNNESAKCNRQKFRKHPANDISDSP